MTVDQATLRRFTGGEAVIAGGCGCGGACGAASVDAKAAAWLTGGEPVLGIGVATVRPRDARRPMMQGDTPNGSAEAAPARDAVLLGSWMRDDTHTAADGEGVSGASRLSSNTFGCGTFLMAYETDISVNEREGTISECTWVYTCAGTLGFAPSPFDPNLLVIDCVPDESRCAWVLSWCKTIPIVV